MTEPDRCPECGGDSEECRCGCGRTDPWGRDVDQSVLDDELAGYNEKRDAFEAEQAMLVQGIPHGWLCACGMCVAQFTPPRETVEDETLEDVKVRVTERALRIISRLRESGMAESLGFTFDPAWDESTKAFHEAMRTDLDAIDDAAERAPLHRVAPIGGDE